MSLLCVSLFRIGMQLFNEGLFLSQMAFRGCRGAGYAAQIFTNQSNYSQSVRFACLLCWCLELSLSALRELGVFWNDAFRKIFGYSKWESVKLLQLICGCLVFFHIYDLFRLRFLSQVVKKLPFISTFNASLELKYHTLQNLIKVYGAYNTVRSLLLYMNIFVTVTCMSFRLQFQCVIFSFYVVCTFLLRTKIIIIIKRMIRKDQCQGSQCQHRTGASGFQDGVFIVVCVTIMLLHFILKELNVNLTFIR